MEVFVPIAPNSLPQACRCPSMTNQKMAPRQGANDIDISSGRAWANLELLNPRLCFSCLLKIAHVAPYYVWAGLSLKRTTQIHHLPRRMSSIEEPPKPLLVTGGCLCGAIRYRVDFPHGHDFAENVSKSCKTSLIIPLMTTNSAW